MLQPEPTIVTVEYSTGGAFADTLTLALINAQEDPAEAFILVEARAQLLDNIDKSTVIRVAQYRGRRGIEDVEIPRE